MQLERDALPREEGNIRALFLMSMALLLRAVKKVIVDFVAVVLHLVALAVGVSVDYELTVQPESARDAAEDHAFDVVEGAAAV